MNRRGLLTIGLFAALCACVARNMYGAQRITTTANSKEPEFWMETSRHFSSRQGAWLFLTFFGFLLILAVGLVFADLFLRRRSKTGIDNPRYLFTELARAHELTRIERQFLTDFADESNLEDPLPLFVEPKYFLSALDDDRFRTSHGMIESMLRKLFNIGTEGPASPTMPQTYSGATTIIHAMR